MPHRPSRRGRSWLLVGSVAGAMLAPPSPVAAQLTDSDFVLTHPATFQMGDAGNGPVHAVTLTHAFWIQRTLVTQAQWQAVMSSNPSHHHNCPTCPVDSVSYVDAQAFIVRLNAMSGQHYRLPTEAEWEYAARAGTTGNDGTPGAPTLGGWTAENSGNQTHPVAALRPNAWGLYDMEGNVAEWVNDWMGPYTSTPVTDPTGPTSGTYRVVRGGSWLSTALFARSAARLDYIPTFRSSITGFRLARTDGALRP